LWAFWYQFYWKCFILLIFTIVCYVDWYIHRTIPRWIKYYFTVRNIVIFWQISWNCLRLQSRKSHLGNIKHELKKISLFLNVPIPFWHFACIPFALCLNLENI
jgi:hypothetical protein